MDELEWERAKWRVAWDEPVRYFLEEIAPEALDALDDGRLDPETLTASLARAFEGLPPAEVNAEVGRVIAPRWLKLLDAGDWGATEAFRRRWDLWDFLGEEVGVALPPADPAWSFGNDGRPAVRPSERTVRRRLKRLGVSPWGA